MTRRPFNNPAPDIGRNSAAVSLSTILAAVFGAPIGLLVVLIAGAGETTQGFLAAYSIYYVALMLAASMRTVVIPIFGPADDGPAFVERVRQVVGRVVVLAWIVPLAIVALAPVLGWLVTSGLGATGHRAAAISLVVLAPAAYCQAHASALAAALGAAQRFVGSSAIFVGGAALSLLLASIGLMLAGALGAACAIAVSAGLVLVGHVMYMRTFGIRSAVSFRYLAQREEWRLGGRLAAASSLLLVMQINTAIAVGVASHVFEGILIYTYAYSLTALILGATLGPLTLVTLPRLVSSAAGGGDRVVREYLSTVFPHALAVLVPFVAGFAAFGKPVLLAVFSSSLSIHVTQQIYLVTLWLVPLLLASVVGGTLYSVVLARDRQARMLPIGAIAILGQSAVTIPLGSLGLYGIVIGHSLATVLVTGALARVAFDRRSAASIARALKSGAPAFGLGLVFLAVRLPFWSEDPPVGWAVGLGICSVVGYALLAMWLWPSVARNFTALARSKRAAT